MLFLTFRTQDKHKTILVSRKDLQVVLNELYMGPPVPIEDKDAVYLTIIFVNSIFLTFWPFFLAQIPLFLSVFPIGKEGKVGDSL